MNARERLLATLKGQPTDRVAVYTHIPFEVTRDGFEPGPFHGWNDCDPWRKNDPAYVRLVKRMEAEGDNFYMWQHPQMQWERIVFSRSDISTRSLQASDEVVQTVKTITAKGRTLQSVIGQQVGMGHSWIEEHWCKSAEDARLILDMDWQSELQDAGDFDTCRTMLGDKGLMWCTIPSPLYIACALFSPTMFYEFVLTERDLITNLLKRMQERITLNLEMLLKAGVGPIIRFGGAERATPPLMGPKDFDELYVRYEQPLFDLCKKYERLIAVHCHGQIRYALKCFVEMGVDQTDPVEAPPSGDVTMRQAREIAGKTITLTGNIQSNEIEFGSPGQIRRRVRQIIDQAGPQKLIITATGTPLKQISPQAEANYNAMIDAVLDYGRVH